MASKESEKGSINKEPVYESIHPSDNVSKVQIYESLVKEGSIKKEPVYESTHPPENVNKVQIDESLAKDSSQRNRRVCWVIVGVVVLIVIGAGIGITVHFLTKTCQEPAKQQTPGKLRGKVKKYIFSGWRWEEDYVHSLIGELVKKIWFVFSIVSRVGIWSP